eukprot:364605-Chlamydomonas_euryale.AAC.9
MPAQARPSQSGRGLLACPFSVGGLKVVQQSSSWCSRATNSPATSRQPTVQLQSSYSPATSRHPTIQLQPSYIQAPHHSSAL